MPPAKKDILGGPNVPLQNTAPAQVLSTPAAGATITPGQAGPIPNLVRGTVTPQQVAFRRSNILDFIHGLQGASVPQPYQNTQFNGLTAAQLFQPALTAPQLNQTNKDTLLSFLPKTDRGSNWHLNFLEDQGYNIDSLLRPSVYQEALKKSAEGKGAQDLLRDFAKNDSSPITIDADGKVTKGNQVDEVTRKAVDAETKKQTEQKTDEILAEFKKARRDPNVPSEKDAWNKAFENTGVTTQSRGGRAILSTLAQQAIDNNEAGRISQQRFESSHPGFIKSLTQEATHLPGQALHAAGEGIGYADAALNKLVSDVMGIGAGGVQLGPNWLKGKSITQVKEDIAKDPSSDFLSAFGGGELLTAPSKLAAAAKLAKLGSPRAAQAENIIRSIIPALSRESSQVGNVARVGEELSQSRGGSQNLGSLTQRGAATGGEITANVSRNRTSLRQILRGDQPFNQTATEAATSAGLNFGAVKPVSKFSMAVNRVRNNLEKMGAPGVAISKMLQNTRNEYEVTKAYFVNKLPTLEKLSQDQAHEFALAAQGKATNDKLVQQAVKEWDSVRDEALFYARKAGLDPGKIENFFPRYFDQSFYDNGSKFNAAVEKVKQALVKDGMDEGAAQQEAEKSLQRLRPNAHEGVPRDRRATSLDFQRTKHLSEGYRTDKQVVYDYIDELARRSAEVRHLGQGDTLATQMIHQIGNEGGRTAQRQAEKLFDTAVNISPDAAGWRYARTFQAATKLGLGALTNAQQSLNTLAETGVRNTVRAIAAQVKNPEAKKYIQETGTTLESVLKDIRTGSGYSTEVLGKWGAPGFNAVERFNRSVAAYSGKLYAEGLAQKAARGSEQALRQLNELGINGRQVAKTGKLTREQEVAAGRKIVEHTQFKVDPQDLPAWASTPLGKLVAQFRTFSYNQTAFVGRLISEAGKGNPAPLVRWSLLSIPTGAAASAATDYLRYGVVGQKPPQKNPLDYFTKAGGVGIPSDIAQGAVFASRGDTAARTASIIGTILGPTAGDLIQGVNAANQGGSQLGKYLTNKLGPLGPTAAHALFPAQATNRGALGKEPDKKDQKQFYGMLKQMRDTDRQQAVRDNLENYSTLYSQGQIQGPQIKLNAREKELASLLVDQNGTLTTDEGRVNGMKKVLGDNVSRELQTVADKFRIMSSQVDWVAADANALQQKADEGRINAVQAEQGVVGLQRESVRQGYDVNATSYAGLNDNEQRRFNQTNPIGAALPGVADTYQQSLINAGLISPNTTFNQAYDPAQSPYKPGKNSRLGIDPLAILAGDVTKQNYKTATGRVSGGSSGGSGSRSGRKRSGGKSKKPKKIKITAKAPKKFSPKKVKPGGGLAALFPGLF